MLKFFQLEVKFPKDYSDIPKSIVVHLAKQVGVSWEEFNVYDWQGRSIKYHRSQNRTFLGFRIANSSDAKEVASWLLEQVIRIRAGHRTLGSFSYPKVSFVAD